MKTITAFLLFFVCLSACGAERLRVVENIDVRPEAVALMEKVAESCTNENFRTYASCFLSRRLSYLRNKVRPNFATKDLDMRVLDVVVDFADKDKMEFEVRYLWSEGFGQSVITADIVAEKENNEWKIGSEKVVGSKPFGNASENNIAFAPRIPQEQNLPFGVREPVQFLQPGDPGWDPDSPKDMPQIPGSCQNGKCGIPRRPEAPVVQLKPGDAEWDPDAPKDFIQVPNSCRDGSCKAK